MVLDPLLSVLFIVHSKVFEKHEALTGVCRGIIPSLVEKPVPVIGGVVGLSLSVLRVIIPGRQDYNFAAGQNRVNTGVPEGSISVVQIMFIQETDQLFAGIHPDLILVMSPEVYMTECTVHHDQKPCADRRQALPLLHILREQHREQKNIVEIDRQQIPWRPLIAGNEDPRHQQVAHPGVNDQESCESVSVPVVADQCHCGDHKHQRQRHKVIDELRQSGERKEDRAFHVSEYHGQVAHELSDRVPQT